MFAIEGPHRITFSAIGQETDRCGSDASFSFSPCASRFIFGQAEIKSDLLCWILLQQGVVVIDEKITKFSHDRQQAAAYQLITDGDKADIHFKIATFFHHSSGVEENFLFDSERLSGCLSHRIAFG